MDLRVVTVPKVQVYILFYKPTASDPLQNRMVAYMDGPYCHVEMAIPDRCGHEPWDRVVWGSSIYQNEPVFFRQKSYMRDGYVSIAIEVTPAQRQRMRSFCQYHAERETPFSRAAMYASYLPFQLFDTESTFCSKHVAQALQLAGLPAVRHLNPALVTPSMLHRCLEGTSILQVVPGRMVPPQQLQPPLGGMFTSEATAAVAAARQQHQPDDASGTTGLLPPQPGVPRSSSLWGHLLARLSPASHDSRCSAGLLEDLYRSTGEGAPHLYYHCHHHHHHPWEHHQQQQQHRTATRLLLLLPPPPQAYRYQHHSNHYHYMPDHALATTRLGSTGSAGVPPGVRREAARPIVVGAPPQHHHDSDCDQHHHPPHHGGGGGPLYSTGFRVFPLAPHACMHLYGVILFVLSYSVNGVFWLPQYSIVAGALFALTAAPSDAPPPASPSSSSSYPSSPHDGNHRYADTNSSSDDPDSVPEWLRDDDGGVGDDIITIAPTGSARTDSSSSKAARHTDEEEVLHRPSASSSRLITRSVGLWALCIGFGLLLVERLLLPLPTDQGQPSSTTTTTTTTTDGLAGASTEALRNLWLGVGLPCATGLLLRGWCHRRHLLPARQPPPHHHHHSSSSSSSLRSPATAAADNNDMGGVAMIRAQSLLSFATPALLVVSITFLSLYLPTQQCAQQLLVLSNLASNSSSSSSPVDSLLWLANDNSSSASPPAGDDDSDAGNHEEADGANDDAMLGLLLNASRAYYSLLGPPSESIGIGTIVIPNSPSGLLAGCMAPSLLWVTLTIIIGCGLRTPSLAASTMGAYLLSMLYHRLLLQREEAPPGSSSSSSSSGTALACALGVSHLAAACLFHADITASDRDVVADDDDDAAAAAPPPSADRISAAQVPEQHDAALGP